MFQRVFLGYSQTVLLLEESLSTDGVCVGTFVWGVFLSFKIDFDGAVESDLGNELYCSRKYGLH